ncbi:MAG TPA: hypothetical protein VGD48_09675 [Kutzneria sp.]
MGLRSFGADPSPTRPLSTVPNIWVFQQLAAGSVDADASIPTLATGGPDKHVRLHVVSYPPELGLDTVVKGTVTAT